MSSRRSFTLGAPAIVVLLSCLVGCPEDEGGAGSGAGLGAAATGGTAGTGGVGGDAASGGTAGSGGTGGGAGVAATFETLTLVINQAPCLGAGCHNDAQNTLDLRVDEQLVARMTAHVSIACGDLPVITPGQPEQSALVKILKGPCGATPRMPYGCIEGEGGSCVPDDYIAAIEQWIANGALRP